MKSILLVFLWFGCFVSFSAASGADQQVTLGERRFFIQNGVVYENADSVAESRGVVDLVTFKDRLFALRANGDVYLLAEAEGQVSSWLWMGSNTRKMLVAEDGLYALTANQQVWKFNYEPDLLIASHYNRPPPNPFDIPILVIHRVAFADLQVRGATDLVLRGDGKAYVIFRDGSEIVLPN